MKKFACLFLLVALCRIGAAAEPIACGPDGCSPALAQIKYHGFDAWRLSDGKTEAIVVPSIGRVMSFRRVGGDEWLWSAVANGGKVPTYAGWTNWGGDKTWLSPQSDWEKLVGQKWPPAKEWDGAPFEAEVLSGGTLRLSGPLSAATGARIIREFHHDASGDFVIKQIVEKKRGAPATFGIWSITQINGANVDAVFLPRGEKSDYENGFRWLSKEKPVEPIGAAPSLLRVVPALNGAYKIGTDAPVAAIAAIKDDQAFVQTASRPNGNYPDGEAGKSGTPVQLFGHGNAKSNYMELELLSPLRKFVAGSRWTHTVKWRIEKLPSENVEDATIYAAIIAAFAK